MDNACARQRESSIDSSVYTPLGFYFSPALYARIPCGSRFVLFFRNDISERISYTTVKKNPKIKAYKKHAISCVILVLSNMYKSRLIIPLYRIQKKKNNIFDKARLSHTSVVDISANPENFVRPKSARATNKS